MRLGLENPPQVGENGFTCLGEHDLDFITGKRIDFFLLESSQQGMLRARAECTTPFTPIKRQEYCSTKCSQKARDRRRKKEEIEIIRVRARTHAREFLD